MQHDMNLTSTHPSGAEEWECPTCGRKLLIQWQPFKRITLVQGDEMASHAACKGMKLNVVMEKDEGLGSFGDAIEGLDL